MKKLYWIRTGKIASLILAVALVVSLLQTWLLYFNDRDVRRMDGFRLEAENSLDVLVLGASEVYTAYSAPYAYELHGITSYPLSAAATPVALWKTMLEDALTRQTPQVVVVDLAGVGYFTPWQLRNNAVMHYVLDNMPLSANKIRTLIQLSDSGTEPGAYFLFPILKYHDVWQDPAALEENLRDKTLQHRRGFTLLRGVSTVPDSVPLPGGIRDISGDVSERDLGEAERFLMDFLEYCRGKDLNVLFTRLPHQIGVSSEDRAYDAYRAVNRAERIVREAGFPVLNMECLADEMGIDPEQDYYNQNHLNLHGQRKVTEYLSRYLVEECGVVPRPQSDAVRAEWASSVEYYRLYCAYVEEQLLNSPNQEAIAENAELLELLDARKAEIGLMSEEIS